MPSRHAQRIAERESSDLLSRHHPHLDAPRRRVLAALLSRTAGAWRLLVDDALPERAARAEAFLAGPGGLFAVLLGEHPPDEDTFETIRRHAEERCAGIRDHRGQVLTGSGLHFVFIGPGRSGRGVERYWTLTERDLPRLFRRDAAHLTRRHVDAIVEQAATRLTGYRELRVRPPERAPEPDGLLSADELTEDEVSGAQLRPFDSWLTFLHPQQRAVVTRHYNGPARISGPAGTGKTVVVLHRLRHLARRSTGPLLFTTFVRTLPAVHEQSFRRLAPEVGDRVEFVNLHAWVREFLQSRGVRLNVQREAITTAFALAWRKHGAPLAAIEPTEDYWRTELHRVIKGRGITTVDDYLRAARKGRALRLGAAQKELVWRLYEAYEERLAARAAHDYNDMISVALEELTTRPLEHGYAAVVVDEVQDITLTGLRLINRLAGEGPNRLLLVGDGQQQVYPGGWSLSDAGIPIQGRGEVLRVNYRNRAGVLTFARRFDATTQVDDLDGQAGVSLLQAESANPGGHSHTWTGTEDELAGELLRQVRELPVPLGQTALIVFPPAQLSRCTRVLREAGVPMLSLDRYAGEAGESLKVGSVHRAKGLDFQAVLVVEFPERERAGPAAEQESDELRGRQNLVAATRARDFLWWATVRDQVPASTVEG
ncbi:UvrD-helicase domain-containing protein [Prauserella cavernicola]|uniref:AAA family ATPase n=1 Tax=Prauserella cavernicola TaxID=2800127 RepID=A0A934QP40_9PSEU|nr:UvrD-helicase domain-containing protein [Prauserella cavernicola]MBK1783795.1 AAA family ATPase [Prauserella cavernicola]